MHKKPQQFQTVAHRVLWGYRFPFSDFAPIESEKASYDAQKAVHTALEQILSALETDPSLLELPTDADRAYEWYVCNNRIPELNEIYLKCCKKLSDFYYFLFYAANRGQRSANQLVVSKAALKEEKTGYKPAYATLLAKANIGCRTTKVDVILTSDVDGLFEAFHLLADKTRKNPVGYFARGVFGSSNDYLLQRLDDLFDYQGLLLQTVQRFKDKGYTTSWEINYQGTYNPFQFRCESAVKDVGFKIDYNCRKKWIFCFGTLSGIGEKSMLENFEHLPQIVQQHMIDICRPCNGCMGCTKGGKNKPFTVTVEYQGKTISLCPQFPCHEWEFLTPQLVERLEAYLEEQVRYQNK